MQTPSPVPWSYAPLGSRARWAVVLLAATIAVDVVAIGFDFWEISLIDRFLDGDTDTGPLASSDDRQAVMGILQIVGLIATAIVFIRWFHAAYRNVAALGKPELRFKPGWAIGGWFVPILSFWRPKQIADDIWRASEPAVAPAEESTLRQGETSGLLTLWWAGWIIATFVGNAAGRVLFNADTLTDIRDSDTFEIASLALDAAAAVLAILVIRLLTSRQLEYAKQIGAPVPA